jgi:hypothetical protein
LAQGTSTPGFRLSKLQDEIGLDHDAAVLRAWLKKTPANFGGCENVQRNPEPESKNQNAVQLIDQSAKPYLL